MHKLFLTTSFVLALIDCIGFARELPCSVQIEFTKDGTMGLGKPIRNKISFPADEVPGEDSLPAVRPIGFQRANFVALHSTFAVWGSSVIYSLPNVSGPVREAKITDRYDSSEYTIMFFGKGRGHKVLEVVKAILEKNGFKIRENVWTMTRRFDPTRYSDTYETSFLFHSTTTEGDCHLVEFRDKNCDYWVLLKYYFQVIRPGM